jgi:hypothetical protein
MIAMLGLPFPTESRPRLYAFLRGTKRGWKELARTKRWRNRSGFSSGSSLTRRGGERYIMAAKKKGGKKKPGKKGGKK